MLHFSLPSWSLVAVGTEIEGPKPQIAFSDLTGDEDQVYFADGLTEELTAELARYQEFQVIAAQSTLQFKGRKVDSGDIGRDLGVRFLLMGSIQKDLKTVFDRITGGNCP